MNWTEGVVPILDTRFYLDEQQERSETYSVVVDLGKDLFAFTLDDVVQKTEIFTDNLQKGDNPFFYWISDDEKNELRKQFDKFSPMNQ